MRTRPILAGIYRGLRQVAEGPHMSIAIERERVDYASNTVRCIQYYCIYIPSHNCTRLPAGLVCLPDSSACRTSTQPTNLAVAKCCDHIWQQQPFLLISSVHSICSKRMVQHSVLTATDCTLFLYSLMELDFIVPFLSLRSTHCILSYWNVAILLGLSRVFSICGHIIESEVCYDKIFLSVHFRWPLLLSITCSYHQTLEFTCTNFCNYSHCAMTQ